MFFFFNDTATTEIYTLSLHDALPIFAGFETNDYFGFVVSDLGQDEMIQLAAGLAPALRNALPRRDRKSTRLNSSHGYISYAVFCLKKKKTMPTTTSSGRGYPTCVTRS